MADHMRRNDKLSALTADASRANARARGEAAPEQQRQPEQQPATHPANDRQARSSASARHAGTRRTNTRQSANAQAKGAKSTNRIPAGEVIKQNLVGILSVAAVVILVVLMIVFLRACGPSSEEEPLQKTAPAAYSSPYDWTKLDRVNGRYSYVVDGKTVSRLGVDVSENQESIDWQAVAQDGIDFAMIRLGYRGATEGDLYVDGYYYANIEGARAAGIDCGIYFFSQAINEEEAIAEADFVLEQLGGTSLEYPIAFDSEVVSGVASSRTASLSNDEMTAIADAFCARLEEAGYSTLVYGNAADISRYNDSVVNDGGIWWAEYNVGQPSHYLDIVMWQYANSGTVAGIPTPVDMNIDLSNAL